MSDFLSDISSSSSYEDSINGSDCPRCSTVSDTIRVNHYRCLEDLIKKGADVNSPGEDGYTPSMYAIRKGYNKCLEALIAGGADVNEPNDPPLITASLFGRQKCLELILKAGGNPNIEVGDGMTALHNARGIAVMRELFRAGAKVNTYDGMEQNALENILRTDYFLHKPKRMRSLCMYLFAAGERANGRNVKQAFRLACRTPKDLLNVMGEMLKLSKPQTNLMDSCRRAIRKQLIDSNDRMNLFVTVPKLPLPEILKNFLLYDVSFEDFTEEEDEFISDSSDSDSDADEDERLIRYLFSDSSDDEPPPSLFEDSSEWSEDEFDENSSYPYYLNVHFPDWFTDRQI